MWDWIIHANTVVTGLGFTGLGGVAVWVGKQIQVKTTSDHLQHDALVAMLHHEIYDLCNAHLSMGYISTDDFDDLGYLYRSYKALGGNGTGERLYEKVAALPIKN